MNLSFDHKGFDSLKLLIDRLVDFLRVDNQTSWCSCSVGGHIWSRSELILTRFQQRYPERSVSPAVQFVDVYSSGMVENGIGVVCFECECWEDEVSWCTDSSVAAKHVMDNLALIRLFLCSLLSFFPPPLFLWALSLWSRTAHETLLLTEVVIPCWIRRMLTCRFLSKRFCGQ